MKLAAAVAILMILPAFASAEDGDTLQRRCPKLDLRRFYISKEMEHARKDFFAKANRLNDSGYCVTDGWWGKVTNKFHFTVIPPGGDQIGIVESFTVEELKK
ncbi:MAG TPA: hypothetical protein VNX25_08695 [Verrucomicrobiae bacterium]|nr:hypothetical protein [Verrucomicrobiae bacterium]